MSSSNKKNLLRSIFRANAGCGCGRPNPSDVVEPTPKPPRPCQYSEAEGETDLKIIDSAVAVVKDSDDPYQDFSHSMRQMILEKQIYSKHDLQQLLNCFLHLNSPSHHDVIIKAFREIDQVVLSLREPES